jgi:hypothetical protein
MATQYKRITSKDTQPKNKGTYLTKENWEVMKPFVHFAFRAMGVVASAIFVIVKFIPKALEHKDGPGKNDKIIKI